MKETELLRETLMDLERARDRERRARVESETVLAALAVITRSTSTEGMFEELFPVLRPLLNFETAVVAAPDGEDLGILWCSDPTEYGRRFQIQEALRRSAQAGALSFFDIGRAPDLAELRRFGTSMLMAPMHMMGGVGALLLFNPKRGAFDDTDHAVLRRLGPLLAQTMTAIQARERRAEAKLQGLARFPQENPRPVFRSDYEGHVLYANPPAQHLLNLSKAEDGRLPESWMHLIHAAQHSATTLEQELRSGGRVFGVSISPFQESGYINLYFTDITERVHATQDLLRSGNRMATLISSSPAGILLEDESRHIVLVNQSLCALFNIPAPPEVLVGADCAAMAEQFKQHFAEPQRFLDQVDEALAKGERREAEQVELADGRWLERSYTPVLLAGEHAGHLWQYVDVTERRRGEQALQAAVASARAANEAKSEFLARMSHEIRTPLNSVLGMSELLLDTPMEDSQRAWLRGVHTNANALLYLINDVLDMARIEAGEVNLNHLPLNPRALAEEIAESFASRAAGQNISLVCLVGPSVPAQVEGDPVRLRQVLANLVANAVKYTDEGGVEIRITHRLLQGKNALKLEVRDSGVGIPAEEQERIFQKYAQVKEGVRGGTGLGLHITKHLVETMGGAMTLESTLGQGSRFTAIVPIKILAHHDKTEMALLTATRALRPLLVLGDAPFEARHIRSILGQSVPMWGPQSQPPDLDGLDVVILEDSASPEQVRSVVDSGLPIVHIAPATGAQHRLTELPQVERVFRPVPWQRLRSALLSACHLGVPLSGSAENPTVERTPLRVLLVDDNADNRAVAQGLLEAAGHSVALAKSGPEGVSRAGEERFDLVLMDLHMPGMDGLTASSAIWHNEATLGLPETRILAFTAHATAEVRDRALSLGMLGFVTKPVQREQLLEAMERTVTQPGRILMVDDSSDIRRLLTHYVRTAAHRGRTVQSGEEALDAVEKVPYQLIIMDIEMPGMGGLAAQKALRERGFARPILALTGHTEPEQHAVLLEAGFNQVLTKPIRRDTLWAALEDWMTPQGAQDLHLIEVDADLEGLIGPFFEDRTRDVRTLRAKLKEGDWTTVQRIGHSMKGNGSSYGFDEISRIGEAIESQARTQDLAAVSESTDALETYLGRVEVRFVP